MAIRVTFYLKFQSKMPRFLMLMVLVSLAGAGLGPISPFSVVSADPIPRDDCTGFGVQFGVPENACDGDDGTWVAVITDSGWIRVDFGNPFDLESVSVLHWVHIWGDGSVQTLGDDGETWTTRTAFSVGPCTPVTTINDTFVLSPSIVTSAVRLIGTNAASCDARLGIFEIWPDGSPVPVAPTVITLPAFDMTEVSSTVSGNVTSLGQPPIGGGPVNLTFAWGTNPSYLVFTKTAGWTNASETTFYANLVGLSPGTIYYFRAQAVGNETPLGFGETSSFQTPGVNLTLLWVLIVLFILTLSIGLWKSPSFLILAGLLGVILTLAVDVELMDGRDDLTRYGTFVVLIVASILIFVQGALHLPEEFERRPKT